MKKELVDYKLVSHHVELDYSHTIVIRGHFDILCEIRYKGKTKTFKHTTTNTQWLDEFNDWKYDENPTHNEVNEYYHNAYYHYFDEPVLEFIMSINDNE